MNIIPNNHCQPKLRFDSFALQDVIICAGNAILSLEILISVTMSLNNRRMTLGKRFMPSSDLCAGSHKKKTCKKKGPLKFTIPG